MVVARDAFAALAVGGAHVLLVWSLLHIVNRAFAGTPAAVRLSAGLVTFWGLVSGCGLFLGAVGVLSPLTLIVAITSAALALRRWVGNTERIPPSGLTAGAVRPPTDRLVTQAGGLLLGSAFLAHVALYGVYTLPADWDSLAYHIPIIDHWVQYGHLYSHDCAFWYVPGNNELLAYWFVSSFSGDFWIGLNNLPSVGLLCASTFALGHVLGLSAFGRSAATATVVLNQPILCQLVSAENDVAVTALCFAALLFSRRWIEIGKRQDLLMFVTAAGLLAGTKYYGLGYAALVTGIPGFWLCCQGQYRRGLATTVAAVIGITVLAAFWYVRNWAMSGTPLYPRGFLGMPDLWATMRPHSATSSLWGTPQLSTVWPILVRAWMMQAGPLAALAALSTPVLVTALLLLARRDKYALWLVVVWWGTGIVYLVTPNVVETTFGSRNMLLSEYHPVRFGLTWLSASVLGAAVVANRLLAPESSGGWKLRISIAVRSVVAAGVVGQALWHFLPLCGSTSEQLELGKRLALLEDRDVLSSYYLPVVVAMVLLITVVRMVRPLRVGMPSLGTAAAVIAWCAASVCLSARWHREFVPHFTRLMRTEAYRQLSHGLGTSDRLCVCDYCYYPFLGSCRQFSVCRPLWLSDRRALEDYLSDERATCVVARYDDRIAGNYRNAYRWMQDDPGRFELVRQNRELATFRLRHPVH